MKIIDNRAKESTKKFVEIKIGETFCTTSSNTIFMKTENFYSEIDDGYIYDRYVIANAFCLNNGKRMFFNLYDNVTPITCECVIKNS